MLTIEQLVELCGKIKGVPNKELAPISEEYGVTIKNIQVLKTLLGYITQPKKVLTPEQKESIFDSVRAGKSCYEIGKDAGINPATVYDLCKRNGVDCLRNFEWTPIKIRLLIDMHMKGFDDKSIADKVGTTRQRAYSTRYRLIHRDRCEKWIPIAEKMGLYKFLEKCNEKDN